jgi:mercuric ion binding protein
MRTILLLTSILLIGLIQPISAQTVETSFQVSGNCNMCKKRIETALDVKGVKAAEWNIETKILRVKYHPSKISGEQIKKLVAGAGYDTTGFTADSAVYEKLPECCRYRGASKHDHPHDHDHPHPHPHPH